MKKVFLLLFIIAVFLLILQYPLSKEEVKPECLISETIKETCEIIKPSALFEPEIEVTVFSESLANKEAETGFDPYEIIDNLSDEELVGQLFLARCPELYNAKGKAEEYHLGGYILFGNHTKYETPESLKSYIEEINRNSEIPMFIAVDEEGGTVSRLGQYSQYRSSNFPSPRYLYNNGGIEKVLDTEKEKCALLKSLGFNLNLAPVCDITTDPNAFMYNRSLGESAETTREYVKSIINLYEKENLGAVLKHFPGYGNNRDTHVGIAIDKRSLDELITNDLIPFFGGISEGCDGILVSHTIITSIDESLPASLSPKVLNFLRNEMNFEGVIITDDLFMEAITDLYGAKESAILAIKAGTDLLCCTEFEIQYEAILDALKSGEISRERLEESAERILLWKYKLFGSFYQK